MRRLFRWLVRLVVSLVVLGILLLLAKDALLKEYTQWRLRKETGCDVSIGRFELSLLKPTLLVENFRLYNPPEFGGGIFISIPELRMEYDPVAAARRELHLKSATLNVSEVNLVQGANRKTNLDLLKERTGRKDKPEKINFTGIDSLTLTLGTLREIKLNKGVISERNFGVTNRVVQNVTTMDDLAPLFLDLLVRELFSGRTGKPQTR